ncbi:MAG: hypothetical protein L0338_39265, partial [Acidobacteria bacterium]|nr:hypothetical protein [Acidobacteriota bacterium]
MYGQSTREQHLAREEARVAAEKKIFEYRRRLPAQRVEIFGDVALPPDHARLHKKDAPPAADPAEEGWLKTVAPLANVAVLKDDSVIEQYIALFPQKDVIVIQFGQGPSWLPFTLVEFPKIAPELSAFYKTGLDITRGPERFEPFLANDLHVYAPMEDFTGRKMTPVEVRRHAVVALDQMFHQVWMEFELRHFNPDGETMDVADLTRFESRMALVEKRLRAKKRELNALGARSPAHIAACLPYLRRYAG